MPLSTVSTSPVEFTRGYELRLDHVTDEENHHTGVDFIFNGPSKSFRSGDVKVKKWILTRNQDDNENEFQGTQRLSSHLPKGRRREVSALNLQPRVTILREKEEKSRRVFDEWSVGISSF